MKKLLFIVYILSFFLIPIKSFSNELNENDKYEYNISESERKDMFSEYIKENSSENDNKSTELYQNEYIFQWYPYIRMKYVSKNIKDQDKGN